MMTTVENEKLETELKVLDTVIRALAVLKEEDIRRCLDTVKIFYGLRP